MASRPGVMDRARLAMQVFRRGMPRPQMKGAAPYKWPAWRAGEPNWHMQDFQTYVTEGFNRNALIYGAVMYKVRAKWLAPLRAYQGDLRSPEKADASHPLAQLLARPNPYQSMMDLEALAVAYLNVAGNSFTYMDRPAPGAIPEAMYALRPDRTFIVPDPRFDGKRILGYWYVPEGRPRTEGSAIPWDDCMHVKLPNPGDPLEGLGEGFAPIEPGGRSADVDNAATQFLKDFFERGLIPTTVIEFDVPIDQQDADEVREIWADMYGGTEGWLRPGVLGQGASVNRLSYSFDEMGFDALDERNETRIIGPFGVPAVLLGARVGLQNATYSNVEGLRRVFWEDTFVPELRLFEKDWEYHLSSEDGVWAAYDLSGVPALQEDVPAMITSAKTLWEMGMPLNQALREVGMTAEPVEGGDIGYVSSTMLPSGSIGLEELDPALPADTAPADDQGPAASSTEEDRDKFWKQRADSAGTEPPPVFESARGKRDLVLMLAILTGEKRRALAEKRSVDWDLVADVMESQVGELLIPERFLLELAKSDGWSIDKLSSELKQLTDSNHVAEHVDFLCPLCQSRGAARYMDHGGLCVCLACGMTYDPQMEFVG